MSSFSFRCIEFGDIARATQLTELCGWPHTEVDWALHALTGNIQVAHARTEAVVAALGSWRYNNLATLGLAITHPEYRGQGLARQMIASLLDSSPAQPWQLVATPLATPLYRSFDFIGVGAIEQWQGQLKKTTAPPASARIRLLQPPDLTRVIEFDKQCNCLDRSHLLRYLFAAGGAISLCDEPSTELCAVAFFRRAGRGTTVGPVIARDQDDACEIIGAVLSSLQGFSRLDVPADATQLVSILEKFGLRKVDEGLLMNRDVKGQSASNLFKARFALTSQALG